MKTNFLNKLFSPPNYLLLPVAGIEICNHSIKFIEFFNKNGVFSIKKFGKIDLAPNIIKDGDIINKNALVEALIKVKNSISSDFVKVSIPEEKTYIFDVKLPKAAEKNIRETLEFKIEENVPLKLEEAYFEYENVGYDEQTKEITLNVSVIPKNIISDYTEVFEQVGIYALSFEIESKMVADAVFQKGDKRNTIVINIKDDSTVLIAIIDGSVRLTSSVSIGENTIRENLLRSGLFGNETEIDKFFENDFSIETLYSKDLYLSLVNIFSVLKDEVEKFSEYIINKFPKIKNLPSENVSRIILCGKSAAMPGLAKHINQNINADVVLADAWSNVFDIKGHTYNLKFNDSLSFVTPIGLVVSSDKQINA